MVLNWDLEQFQNKMMQKIPDILKRAKEKGASSAEVSASMEMGISVNVRQQATDTLEFQRDKGIGISVFFGHKSGSASITDLSESAIEYALEAACHIARYTQDDPCNGLPEKSFLATNIPDLDLFHPWAFSAEEVIEKAKRCELAGLESDSRIHNSEGAYVTSHASVGILGNSLGFLAAYPSTLHSMGCVLLAKQGDQMQRDSDYTVGRALSDLESESVVGQSAAEKTLARLGGRKIKTQKVPVVFAPKVARSLWGHLLGAISGSSLYRKRSFLLDHANQQVLPEFVSFSENPHLPKGLRSAPFDTDGVATQSRQIVEKGILTRYLLGTYSGRKLALNSTGNAGGARNVFISPNCTNGQAGILQKMGKGLLITELMGHGVNLTTGDYSRGAFGFWVQEGVIQYPVEEITIAGNLKEIFLNLVGISDEIDLRGNIQTGSVLVAEMTVAGD